MNIFLTIPAFNPPHGGIRILIEWANRLSKWHSVTIYCPKPSPCKWKTISSKVHVTSNTNLLRKADCLIIGSPHAIHLQRHPAAPKKIFIFMQMVEHLFRPTDIEWNKQCKEFYTTPHPIIAISQWNIDVLKKDFGRTAPTYYVGNGVNFDDFPLTPTIKDGRTVLIEGWEGYNPAKDVDHIGPKVAARLKSDGYTILSYGQVPLKTMPEACDKYFLQPDLKTINCLYEKATILVKASKYDARSCAPVEAMTKGTVTARAIIQGDDDLIDTVNCLKVDYNEQHLYYAAKMLLSNEGTRNSLSENCLQHVKQYDWDYWMEKINQILCNT